MKIIYLVLVYYVVVIGNTSLVLSDYIDEEKELIDALHLVLINNSTSLYELQKLFYPPGEVSPDTVVFNPIVTVNTIPDNNSCNGSRSPAFKKYDDHYVRNFNDSLSTDHFSVSNDAFSNYQAKLKAYITSINVILEGLEYTSYHLIMTITNIQLSPPSDNLYRYTLYLKVDKLEVMPCEYDYVDAMNFLLSWVSIACHPHLIPTTANKPPKNLNTKI